MGTASVDAARRIKRWRENPLQFAHEVFQFEPDVWQERGLRALESTSYIPRRRIGFKACTGPGKTAALAILGWWRLLCFGARGQHPKGAALSGEGRDNLRDNLWAEMSKWQMRSELLRRLFTWSGERIYANDHPETWFLAARSYPKEANAEAIGRSLSGLHTEFPFILLDEIGDMPTSVGQKASQIFTGGVVDGLIAGAGNPTSTSGLLYQIFVNEPQDWFRITITADPDDPDRTPRVDAEHAREQIIKYGRENPWVMATILGLFPESAINTLMTVEDVEAAMHRRIDPEHYQMIQKRIGVDVARYGMDRTILFPRQGLMAWKPVEMRGASTDQIAARLAIAKDRFGSELEAVDGTGGWGAGVVDALRVAGYSPLEINFASAADDDRFANKRAEMWFRMAKWVKRGSLPLDPELPKELAAPTYTFSKGRFLLEPKEAIQKRLGFSPDKGDGLALTFCLPDLPMSMASLLPGHRAESNATPDWDPYRGSSE